MNIVFDKLPETLEEFQALPQLDLTVPENTCALFLAALNLYVKNREDGIVAINILRGPRPMSNMEIQFIRDRLMDKTYLPLAYFEGATPANNYTPDVPYMVSVSDDPRPNDIVEPGYIRRYVRTTGADSPRAIMLRKKGTEWFLWEYPAVVMGIRVPACDDPWA